MFSYSCSGSVGRSPSLANAGEKSLDEEEPPSEHVAERRECSRERGAEPSHFRAKASSDDGNGQKRQASAQFVESCGVVAPEKEKESLSCLLQVRR
jgi:hypothetical protein